jgi:hypothetical protein
MSHDRYFQLASSRWRDQGETREKLKPQIELAAFQSQRCLEEVGALIGILTLRMVRKGEELLLDYGEAYWRARGRNMEHRAQGTLKAKVEKQKTLI